MSLLTGELCEFARTNRLELCCSASLRTLYNAQCISVSASRFGLRARASAVVCGTLKNVELYAF